MSAPVQNPSPAKTRGFIVVAALWMMGALASLASIYSIYVIDTAVSFRGYDERLRAEALVSAALELTAYRLTTPTTSPRGTFSFRMDDARATVDYRPETARIDLNAASVELLAGLFAVAGADRDQALEEAKRVVAWRTARPKGDDPEGAAYRAAGLAYRPRGAPFPHVNELSLVLGLSPGLVDRVLPFVTVYSGRPQVDVLDAAPEVIAALPGMTPQRVEQVLAQRRLTPNDAAMITPLLGPARSYVASDAGKATRVRVRVEFDGGRRITSEVVIVVFERSNQPYSIVSWDDDVRG